MSKSSDRRSLLRPSTPRRFLALIQDPRGYGKNLEPAPPEGPSQPMLFHVVKADEHEAEVERLHRLLWECHREASDGIPVPFERWLADGGPEGMPHDVRELREAYDVVSEELHGAP